MYKYSIQGNLNIVEYADNLDEIKPVEENIKVHANISENNIEKLEKISSNLPKGEIHKFYCLNNKILLVIVGDDCQQIIINLDGSRIIVISAGQEGWYNTKSIAYDLIKSGKMKSGNWN